MALTASAPPEIEREITPTDPIVINHSLNRPNMYICIDKKFSCLVSFRHSWCISMVDILDVDKNCLLSFVSFQNDFMELGEQLKNCNDPSIFPKTVV